MVVPDKFISLLLLVFSGLKSSETVELFLEWFPGRLCLGGEWWRFLRLWPLLSAGNPWINPVAGKHTSAGRENAHKMDCWQVSPHPLNTAPLHPNSADALYTDTGRFAHKNRRVMPPAASHAKLKTEHYSTILRYRDIVIEIVIRNKIWYYSDRHAIHLLSSIAPRTRAWFSPYNPPSASLGA